MLVFKKKVTFKKGTKNKKNHTLLFSIINPKIITILIDQTIKNKFS